MEHTETEITPQLTTLRKPWTVKEEEQLNDELKEIAKKHERTVGSIVGRIMRNYTRPDHNVPRKKVSAVKLYFKNDYKPAPDQKLPVRTNGPKWTIEKDEELTGLFNEVSYQTLYDRVPQMAEKTGRSNGAILRRLMKLGLIDQSGADKYFTV